MRAIKKLLERLRRLYPGVSYACLVGVLVALGAGAAHAQSVAVVPAEPSWALILDQVRDWTVSTLALALAGLGAKLFHDKGNRDAFMAAAPRIAAFAVSQVEQEMPHVIDWASKKSLSVGEFVKYAKAHFGGVVAQMSDPAIETFAAAAISELEKDGTSLIGPIASGANAAPTSSSASPMPPSSTPMPPLPAA